MSLALDLVDGVPPKEARPVCGGEVNRHGARQAGLLFKPPSENVKIRGARRQKSEIDYGGYIGFCDYRNSESTT